MTESYYPKFANSGPAPEVTPHGEWFVRVQDFDADTGQPVGEPRMMWIKTPRRQSFTFTMPKDEPSMAAADAAEKRASFAESLLCATVWEHVFTFADACGCHLCDAARGGGR